jgi:Tfp pilus assembly protein PilF
VKENSKSSPSFLRNKEAIFYFSVLTIVGLSFAAYGNTLFNGFVYDDRAQIVMNQWIKDVKYLPNIFFRNVWGFTELEGVVIEGISNYYRPLMHAIYMITYFIFGLKPWGFHLVNIIFHTGVSLLVFLIAIRLLKENQTINYFFSALIATVWFTLHPIHTEVVAWIAGIPELSFTFFYLLSFYLYMLATERDSVTKWAYSLSVASFFLATFCKEPALTLPIVLVAYDYGSNKISLSHRSFKHLKLYLPYLIAGCIYFGMRAYVLEGFAPIQGHPELSNFQLVINVFPLFIQYLQKLIMPINLNAHHILHPITSALELRGVVSFALTAAFVVCFFVVLKKNKTVFLCLVLIVIPLLPALYIPALGENTFAERYLYLPSVGFALMLAVIIARVLTKRPNSLAIILIGFFAITVLYFIGTIKRNAVWRDNYTLWIDTVKKSPNAALPHSELGIEYLERGLFDKAAEHFETAIKLEPDNPDYHSNLGLAYSKKGWIDKGISQFLIALRLDSHHINSYYNLGLSYESKGLLNMAMKCYQAALKLNPRHLKAHINLGILYGRKGMAGKAVDHFRAALAINPDDPTIHHNIANAYEMLGLREKAAEHRSKANSLQNK